jgi:hypothetical protein
MKIIREGPEFHSCRIKLIRIAAFSRRGALLKPWTAHLPARNLLRDLLDLAAPQAVRRRVPRAIVSQDFVRRAGQFQLHAFVVMPEHVHLLLTPSDDVTIERAIQFIKGGYSHTLGAELGRKREVWQRGFTDHRIPRRSGLCPSSGIHSSESGKAATGGECNGIPLLLRVSGLQVGWLASCGGNVPEDYVIVARVWNRERHEFSCAITEASGPGRARVLLVPIGASRMRL